MARASARGLPVGFDRYDAATMMVRKSCCGWWLGSIGMTQ